jgi:chromate transporter
MVTQKPRRGKKAAVPGGEPQRVVSEPSSPSAGALALGFARAGLSSVGGAAGPLRHMLVKQQHWISEGEFAEVFSLGQALPGANAVNVAVMLGDRFAGPLGALAAVAGLCVPSFVIALILAAFATRAAATNAHFAAAETAVTAAVAGIFVANGVRLFTFIWRDEAAENLPSAWRCARGAVSALAVLLVAGLHWWIPVAVPVLVGASILVERAIRARTLRRAG